jgi:hypothetical protein
MPPVIAEMGCRRPWARRRAAGTVRRARLASARSGSFLGPPPSDSLLQSTTAPIGEDIFFERKLLEGGRRRRWRAAREPRP